jgi:hypothetical protein
MSLYPEQKKLLDEIYAMLKKPEARADGMMNVQMQILIQWMLMANALEVIAESLRARSQAEDDRMRAEREEVNRGAG